MSYLKALLNEITWLLYRKYRSEKLNRERKEKMQEVKRTCLTIFTALVTDVKPKIDYIPLLELCTSYINSPSDILKQKIEHLKKELYQLQKSNKHETDKYLILEEDYISSVVEHCVNGIIFDYFGTWGNNPICHAVTNLAYMPTPASTKILSNLNKTLSVDNIKFICEELRETCLERTNYRVLIRSLLMSESA